MAAKEAQEPSGLPGWDELLGYGADLAAWRELAASGRLPQVMLLVGRDGAGKRGLLSALAALHVCDGATACGSCDQCRWLRRGSHPEILWLEPRDGRILIEDAAALQDFLALNPGSGARARVAVVVDADRLTVQAANRLLKTLEEPGDGARIYLSTSRPKAMLPTVLSRCVTWRLRLPSLAVSREWLARRYAAAGQAVPAAAALDSLLKRAALAPGIALTLAGLAGDATPWSAPELGDASVDGASRAIARAGEVGRGSGLTTDQLIGEWEIALNDRYRAALAQGRRPSAAEIAARRALLRDARRVGAGGRVPLNAQLYCEAMALAGVAGSPSPTEGKDHGRR